MTILYLLIALSVILGILCVFFFYAWRNITKKLISRTRKFNIQLSSLDKKIFEAKKQLEATFDSITDGIVVVDNHFAIRRLNRSYAKLTGKRISEILGQKCYSILRGFSHPCPECPVINAQYQDGFTCSVEKQKYQIEVKSTVKSKEASSYIETIRDITRFEKLNEQLRRTERLATIGTMVAGIAHEMNNPLSGISGNSQLMLRTPEKYGLNTKGSNRIGTIFQSAQRATLIMKDLLSFSNPSEIHFQSINVASLLRDTLAEFNTEPIPNISLAPSSSQQHLEVWGDFYQLKSAVKKIIENSIQAVNEQAKSTPEFTGRINIETQNQDNIIIIKVTDNGCGFPEEKLAMVFDPFFTTKDPGKGVGLGLSICHRIITEHFGRIKIENLDLGAQVLIYLPSERPVETRF